MNVAWGRDNRTTGFRVVGSGPSLHIECRFPGGDMNAYLAYAALIGAGLHGVARTHRAARRDARQRATRRPTDRASRAPCTRRSVELESSTAAVSILGQEVVDHYLNAARVEQATYDAVVHPWDRERYLERS